MLRHRVLELWPWSSSSFAVHKGKGSPGETPRYWKARPFRKQFLKLKGRELAVTEKYEINMRAEETMWYQPGERPQRSRMEAAGNALTFLSWGPIDGFVSFS